MPSVDELKLAVVALEANVDALKLVLDRAEATLNAQAPPGAEQDRRANVVELEALATRAARIKEALGQVDDALRRKLCDQRPPRGLERDTPGLQQAAPELLASGEPIDLRQYRDVLNSLIEADTMLPEEHQQKPREDLVQTARAQYAALAKFIQLMNPYGLEVVMVPDLKSAGEGDRTDLDNLWKNFGIQVAGWLQRHVEENPMESSDYDMNDEEEAQSYHWAFAFPDDLKLQRGKGGKLDRASPVGELQITKAVRIPFIYRQKGTDERYPERKGRLLLGHIVIGYEGAGGM